MRVVMLALILLLILVLAGSPAWRGLRCRRSVPLPRVSRAVTADQAISRRS
jgi:hypothetical protein